MVGEGPRPFGAMRAALPRSGAEQAGRVGPRPRRAAVACEGSSRASSILSTVLSAPPGAADAAAKPPAGPFPREGVSRSMRRYELMLVLRPDVPEDRIQAVLDRSTRSISDQGGQIVKVSPWGRRRL